MNKEEKQIDNAKEYVKELLNKEYSGHDYAHTLRVFNTAVLLAQREGADERIVSLAALLHDVDDRKISPETVRNLDRANAFLRSENCSQEEIEWILTVIREVSFAGRDSVKPSTAEGECVQDADRLDALGAIGIARAFAYGGKHDRPLYDPEERTDSDLDRETYYTSRTSTVGHFYEKLLLLEDMMNTEAAKQIAKKRTSFMKAFLKEFYAEYEGVDIITCAGSFGSDREEE